MICMYREIVWELTFRGFMDEQSIKRQLRESDEAQRGPSMNKSGRMRKKTERRDLPQSTPSLAVFNSDEIVVKRTSKKINYNALMGAFDDDGNIKFPSASVTAAGSVSAGYVNVNNAGGMNTALVPMANEFSFSSSSS